MRRRFLCFLAFAAALTAFGGKNARDQELRNKQAAQTAAIAEHRGKLIRREIARVPSGRSWDGEYYLGDGLGVNQASVVAPQAGFVFEWQGCPP